MHFKKLILSSIGVIMAILTPTYTAAINQTNKEAIISTSLLAKVPTEKATIGVIPYIVKDDEVFLLLGRERIDGVKKERAGKYSDFGGTVEVDGSTLVKNAVRELSEETMNKISVSEQDLLDKGKILYKVSSKNREILYIFYPMSAHEFDQTLQLDNLWPSLCQHRPEAEECEKDKFVWLNANDLHNQAANVRDLNGNASALKLREYFVKDCLEHPDFSKTIGALSTSKNKSNKP